jgi:hypothetical protein
MLWVGCIRYTDVDGTDREYSYIREVSDMARLEAFANAVAPLIGATVSKLAVTETQFVEIPGLGNNPDLSMHLQVNVRDPDGNRKGFMLPAPAHDCLELVNGVKRLKETYGEQLASYFSTLIGVTCTFVSGALVGP